MGGECSGDLQVATGAGWGPRRPEGLRYTASASSMPRVADAHDRLKPVPRLVRRWQPMRYHRTVMRAANQPVSWWGWHWEPPVPLSIVQILRAGNMPPPPAAGFWLALERGASLIVAAD